MLTRVTHRCSALVIISLMALLAASCASNPENAIVGKWKFIGIGDVVDGETTIPADSEEIRDINSKLSSAVNIEYQFYKDGTVIYTSSKKSSESSDQVSEELTNVKETGTYRIIADGNIIQIDLAASDYLLRLLGITDSSSSGNKTYDYNFQINGNQLVLRYERPVTEGKFSLQMNFEKVE